MRRILLPALAVGGFLALAAADRGLERPILGPETWSLRKCLVGEEIMAFHKPTRFYENEFTGSMFISRKGWKYIANLFYFKMGPQYKWGLSVTVVDPENNYYLGKKEIETDEVTFSPDSAHVSFGDSFIRGENPNYHIRYVADKVTVDYHVKSRVRPFAPGNGGKFTFGPDGKWFYNAGFGVPWGDITGYVKVDGQKHEIRAQGYIDHGHWSVPFYRHNPAWEGFYAWTWEPQNGHMYAIQVSDFLIHEAYGGKKLGMGIVIKDNRIVCATPRFNVYPEDKKLNERTGVKFPWRIDARTLSDAPCSISGTSRAQYAWEVLDIFDELPTYIRVIAKKLLKRPVYFRACGQFNGTVKFDGEQIRLNTPSFHDANYVR